jgi:ABC-type transport system substrate-binding protein
MRVAHMQNHCRSPIADCRLRRAALQPSIDNRQSKIGNAFLFHWPLLAVLLLISSASGETRPRYGGTLRVEMRAAPPSLDPAATATGMDPGFAQIAPLVYDTLVGLDNGGRPMHPSLAACQPETGPFRVDQFQPGRQLALAAVEDSWHGRPFVDAIEIQFNRAARDQAVDLDLGRADLVEVAPDQLARLAGRRVFTSDPVELLALRFSHSNLRDARVREAIALTVDRDSIYSVLLQRRGEATGGLLPKWITGYSFLFAASPQLARARQLRAEAKQTAALTLVYDTADPLAHLVAERIALNANEAGIILKTAPSTQNIAVPDIELVRVRLASMDAGIALAEISRTDRLALSSPEAGGSSQSDVYRQTVSALQDHWAVPIAYLPVACAIGQRVRNWSSTRDGSWRLDSLWLAAEAR